MDSYLIGKFFVQFFRYKAVDDDGNRTPLGFTQYYKIISFDGLAYIAELVDYQKNTYSPEIFFDRNGEEIPDDKQPTRTLAGGRKIHTYTAKNQNYPKVNGEDKPTIKIFSIDQLKNTRIYSNIDDAKYYFFDDMDWLEEKNIIKGGKDGNTFDR